MKQRRFFRDILVDGERTIGERLHTTGTRYPIIDPEKLICSVFDYAKHDRIPYDDFAKRGMSGEETQMNALRSLRDGRMSPLQVNATFGLVKSIQQGRYWAADQCEQILETAKGSSSSCQPS
ncbi:hypothetical protein CU103_20285 [Phyllobacterium sophorae]|uniref:Uncharacterized protein n=1 Tax=Phyllobacterium sophorae TaxID=1520277 RepID=A0A2P7B6U5_9HYPH|nr:hypothetical protein CU103_20285 [Phyllobacterium sophorae]